MDDVPVEQLGKGALPDPPDSRDYIAEYQFGAAAPIDWSVPFRLPKAPKTNQRSSDACVAYSTSTLHWRFKGKNFSRRDLFSRIALSLGNGAYIRDGVKMLCTKGQQDQVECPDPVSPTPANMRVKSTSPDSAGADDLEANYFVVKQNSIDGAAQAIRDFNGGVLGVTMSNAGWKDKTNPRPPKAGEATDGHAIDLAGYHLHDGIKCIICESSWADGSHYEHHIKEDYFTSGNTFNAWCLIPKEDQFMTNAIIIKREITLTDGTKKWEYLVGDPATTPDGMITLLRNRGINPPLKADGSLDFDQLDNMLAGVVTEIK